MNSRVQLSLLLSWPKIFSFVYSTSFRCIVVTSRFSTRNPGILQGYPFNQAGIFQEYLFIQAGILQGFKFMRLELFRVQVFEAGIPQGFRFLRLEFFRGSRFWGWNSSRRYSSRTYILDRGCAIIWNLTFLVFNLICHSWLRHSWLRHSWQIKLNTRR